MDTNDDPILAFLAASDPGQPPAPGQYVARANSVQSALAVGLRPLPRSRVLLVGQTGVGKTTEIQALVDSNLGATHTVLTPFVDRDVDLAEADWADFLVYSSGAAIDKLTGLASEDAKERPVRDAINNLNKALAPKVERTIREKTTEQPLTGMAGLSAALSGTGPKVSKTTEKTITSGGPPEPTIAQRFRNDTKAVHRQIASAPAQFWDLASAVFSALEHATGKPVVVVLDGLEKLPASAATQLFSVRGNALANWPTRLLVTGPLGMTAEPWFSEVEERFAAVEHLRALPTGPSDVGGPFMLELARRRAASTIMDTADIAEQVQWSAGLPRQFLQLLTRAAQDAAAAGLSRVPAEFHQRARYRLAQRWQYQLEPQDIKALATPVDRLTKGARNRLLRVGALIEYDLANGSLEWKVNPLVQLLYPPGNGDGAEVG